MRTTNVLILTDDAEFARLLTACWQMERQVPGLSVVTSDLWTEDASVTPDLIVIGPLKDGKLTDALRSVPSNTAVILCAAPVATELGAHGIAADVGTSVGAQQIFDRVPRVDILINNVGIFTAEPAFDIDDDGWRRMFYVNVLSGIRLTRRYAKGMAERRHGRVIFICSEAGVQPPTNMVHYGMSKTAQLAVSRGFAQALAGTGVTVNCVLAGPTMSDGVLAMWDDIYPGLSRREQEERFIAEGRAAGSLLGRVIRPEEIAHLVTYLSSDFASATTGRALGADGGLVPTIIP